MELSIDDLAALKRMLMRDADMMGTMNSLSVDVSIIYLDRSVKRSISTTPCLS